MLLESNLKYIFGMLIYSLKHKVISMRNTRIQYETSKYKLHKGTVIGHFRHLLDMDVRVIGHLHIFSNIVKYI